MKLYLMDPLYKHFLNNNIFNTKINPFFIVWIKIRDYLKKEGIIFSTVDLYPVEKADKIFFLDHQDFTLFNNHMNPYLKECLQKKIPKKKLNLIITECPIIKPESWSPKNHVYYDKVFTWDNRLVDNKKYFYYYWLQNIDVQKTKPIPFNKKKLITLINAQKTNYLENELYSLRLKAIRYFEKKHPDGFDLYGINWGKPLDLKYLYSILKYRPYKVFNFLGDYLDIYKGFPSYRGQVGDKIQTLSHYRFSLCFENMKGINGYVTEKIFDSFWANCVPVYLGANNINTLIPKNTFIDFRKFKNFVDLYDFLTNVTEKQYNKYLMAISNFLKSPLYKKWGYQSFCKKVLQYENKT